MILPAQNLQPYEHWKAIYPPHLEAVGYFLSVEYLSHLITPERIHSKGVGRGMFYFCGALLYCVALNPGKIALGMRNVVPDGVPDKEMALSCPLH